MTSSPVRHARATEAVECPICGWAGTRFEPMGRTGRLARCPRCSSLERHRSLFLYLRDETDVLRGPTRLLHFAPEPALRAVLDGRRNIEYVTTDLDMPDVALHMSITDLLFRDDVFDCVICSHVLEHVDDDRAAMREIGRVLKPSGRALILVPILSTPDGRTFEDPTITTAEERLHAYGQVDHVRAYGADFPDRAREAGLEVTAIAYPQQLGADAIKRFGLDRHEKLFVCGAPAAETATAHGRLAFAREVSPRDTMMRPGAPERYYGVGLEALRIIDEAVAAAGAPPPQRILDLPSGHGRVTRMLRAAYPDADITACDVDPDAVEFCAGAFDCRPIVAPRDPALLDLPSSYDVAWCGSLVTHLPEGSSRDLMRQFERCLAPGGLLVLTTHGERIAGMLQRGQLSFGLNAADVASLVTSYRTEGFGFQPYEQSADASYGIALTSREWLLAALDGLPRLELVSYREAEWDGRQDVAICQAGPGTLR